MKPEKETCHHDHGGYAPGPVYVAFLRLPSGMILTSSPGTGEDIAQFLKDMRKAQKERHLPRGTSSELSYIGPSDSRARLEQAAAQWRSAARTVETHLAPRHTGFKTASEQCLAHADRLEAQARDLTN